MSARSRFRARRCCRGLTLIELIAFIIIVSVGLAGVLSVFNVAVVNSADPMSHKTMLSIAEALLEEVEAQPFSYCDQELDAGWSTSPDAATCTIAEDLGAEASQARGSASHPFNDVSDYDGLTLNSSIADISGTYQAPAGYSARISVIQEALNGVGSDSTLDMVRIRVTVCHAAVYSDACVESLALEGYRARFWPNEQPW